MDKLIAALIVIVLGLVVYANIKCWNVPIAERKGICAALHQN